MKNKKALVLAAAGLLVLAGCNNKPSSSSKGSSSETTSSAGATIDSSAINSTENVNVKMSVQYQKADTRMSFGTANVPYTSTVGGETKVYNSGDLKPVWEEVQNRMNITINDVTPKDSVTASFSDFLVTGLTKDKVNILQGGSTGIQEEGITNGTILNLKEYLDYMPNFKAFLEENEIVENTITAGNGAIYYAPYFDGYDDIERMIMVRADWVKKLLDTDATYDTTATISAASYQPFMPDSLDTTITTVNAAGTGTGTITKKYAAGQGIIARQNALSTLNGNSLTTTLKDYIRTTYGDQYAKPSDLFLGQNAAYDADELIALFRCVKTNPRLLTGDANKAIVPFFPREYKNSRVAQIWSFAQIWGVRGVESRNGYLYVNDQGEIVDARGTQDMVDALERLNQMYREGLILKDFVEQTATESTSGDFRNALLTGNNGFATYDYNQTTTALNDNANIVYNPETGTGIEGFHFDSILPAVVNWNNSDEYTYFTESWRSVKTEGWCITADTAKDQTLLARCIKLFDYFYGEEGNRLMSYGPDRYLAKNADNSIKTMNYQGQQVPVLAEGTLTELKELASNNYTNYYRKWLGATFPVGYVKQQGMEYQCVTEKGKVGLDKINKAIELGVLKHVTVQNNTGAARWFNMIPTTFAFSASEQTSITTNYQTLNEAINNTNGKSNIWTDYVIYGFGSTITDHTTLSKEGYLNYLNGTTPSDLNLDGYVRIHQRAYNRMLAGQNVE